MEKRLNWIDSAKGLGILLVIVGHTPIPNPLRSIIYSFHMPLFFLLSGFFLMKKKRTLKEEFFLKFKSLLIPYFVFNIITFIFFLRKEIISYLLGTGSDITISMLLDYVEAILIGNRNIAFLWFLPCLFFSEMLIILLHQYIKNLKLLCIILVSLGCLTCFCFKGPLPFDIDNVFIAASFIAIGVLYRENELPKLVFSPFFLMLIYVVFVYLSLLSTDYIGIDMSEFRYGNVIYFYIAAFSASVLILLLFQRYPNNRVLTYLGRNSLIIYCTQYMSLIISFAIVKEILQQPINPYLESIVETVMVCFMSIPIIYLVLRFLPWSIGKFSYSKR